MTKFSQLALVLAWIVFTGLVAFLTGYALQCVFFE